MVSEEIRAYKRQYRLLHREQANLVQKKWRDSHRDQANLANKKWRDAHKDQVRAGQHNHYARHKEEKAIYRKRYRAEHREQDNAWARHYRKTGYRYAVKALSCGVSATIFAPIIQRVYEDNIKKYGTLTCYLCLQPIAFGKDHLEHRIPISRGGELVYENLGVSCPNCNMTKGTKTEEEYRHG